MPNKSIETYQKFQMLKNTQEAIPVNQQKLKNTDVQNPELNKKRQIFLQHNSVEESKKEVEFIDRLLSNEYMEDEDEITDDLPEVLKVRLTEEDRAMLVNRKSLDLINILFNVNKKEDSTKMKSLKIDLLNLSKAMEESRNKPATIDTIENVEVAINMAIESCRDYLENKNPKFKTGKERKRMVHDVFINLIYQSEIIAVRKEILKPGSKEKAPETAGEFFGLLKDEGQLIERPETKDNVEVQVNMPESLKDAAKFFGEGYRFADEITKKYTTPEDILRGANEIGKLYEMLSKFTLGRFEMCDTEIAGKNVKLVHRSNGMLSVISDHKEYPLPRSLSTMKIEIENDIFTNSDVYGEDRLKKLMTYYESADFKRRMNSGENSRIRAMLSKYLADKTGLAPNDMVNTFRTDMMQYVKQLLNKEKTSDEIKRIIVENSKKTIFINGVAVSEMAELNKNRIDDLKDIVELNTQINEEVIEKGWTKEEQQVKDMIADLIFNSDTEKMDKAITNPAAYVKAILETHKEAIEFLVSKKDQEDDVVTGILKKMSIADLDGDLDGTRVKLSSVVSESINRLRDLYKNANGGEISEASLEAVMKELDTVVDQSCKIMQKNADIMIDVILPQKKQGEDQDDEKSLREEVADVIKSDKGQGKFMRNVMNSYFANVNTVDKRAMLASVFRTAKIVPEVNMPDEMLIEATKKKYAGDPQYQNLFTKKKKDKHGSDVYDLTEADKAAIAQYREYLHTLRVQSNFMGGLIRGAGPLMHKMLQGFQLDNLPKEIKEAISDVKSNLLPIPDNLVRSEFISLIESSGGRITKIERIRSLGAASVGHTFLCKVYGPAQDLKNGKEVVIKILRPEAKNRMLREESIMLEAARETDEAMYLTYKGQLENYKKELDLSIEAKNISDGYQSYQNKIDNVETIKVLDGVPASSTSLIVEKSEGENLDAYIKSLSTFADEALDGLYQKQIKEDGTVTVFENINYGDLSGEELNQFTDVLAEKKKLLCDKIDEAIKRRDHLINLCTLWIDQGVMNEKSGFFHGDLHSGNILISDNKATFIDYGNTVQLTDVQQIAIEKMTVAALCSVFSKNSKNPSELFFDAFDSLIKDNDDPEFRALYTDQKKEELKKVFKETLVLGDEHETGYRISLCLAKAQELGVKIPPAVQSFSQGQIRLQNTIDELNRSIEKIKKGINKIDNAGTGSGSTANPIMQIAHELETDETEGTVAEKFSLRARNLAAIDEEDFKKSLLANKYIEGGLSKGIADIDERKNCIIKYFERFAPLTKKGEGVTVQDLHDLGMSNDDLLKAGFENEEVNAVENTPTLRQRFNAYFDKHSGPEINEEERKKDMHRLQGSAIPAFLFNCMDNFGGYNLYYVGLSDSLINMDRDRANKIFDMLEKLPKYFLVKKRVDNLWAKQEKGFSGMTDQQKNEEVNAIYESYKDIHDTFSKNASYISNVEIMINRAGYEVDLNKQISSMYSLKKDGLGEKLKNKFDEYYEIKKRGNVETDGDAKIWTPKEGDEEAFEAVCKEFLVIYSQACAETLKDYVTKLYSRDPSIAYKDYDTVMETVIKKNLKIGEGNKLAVLGAILKLGLKLGAKTVTVLKESFAGE